MEATNYKVVAFKGKTDKDKCF